MSTSGEDQPKYSDELHGLTPEELSTFLIEFRNYAMGAWHFRKDEAEDIVGEAVERFAGKPIRSDAPPVKRLWRFGTNIVREWNKRRRRRNKESDQALQNLSVDLGEPTMPWNRDEKSLMTAFSNCFDEYWKGLPEGDRFLVTEFNKVLGKHASRIREQIAFALGLNPKSSVLGTKNFRIKKRLTKLVRACIQKALFAGTEDHNGFVSVDLVKEYLNDKISVIAESR